MAKGDDVKSIQKRGQRPELICEDKDEFDRLDLWPKLKHGYVIGYEKGDNVFKIWREAA